MHLAALVMGAFSLVVGCADAASSAGDGTSSDSLQEVAFDPSGSYDERIQLYEFLEQAHPYPEGWADQRAGILLQTKWQDESGRNQRDASGRLFNWWSNVNWTLTTWQAEAVSQRGELEGASIVPFDSARFVLPPEVAASVHHFYDELQAARAEVGALSPDEDREAQRQLRKLLWAYHVNAIKTGLSRNEDELQRLPEGERDFAEAWGKSVVDILAVINFPTDEETTARGQELILPMRIVRPEDFNLLAPSDLPFTQRSALIGMRTLHRFETKSNGLLRRFLERFVDSEAREALLAEVIERAFVENGGGIVGAILDVFDPFPIFGLAAPRPLGGDDAELARELSELRRIDAELQAE